MFQVAAGQRVVAALVAAAFTFSHAPARAQDRDPLDEINQPLDPSAPLDPLPDLGVEWPNMEEADDRIADAPDTSIADAATEQTYDVRLTGLEGIAADGLVEQFNQLSTLRANRNDAANAAQIDRRAREDSQALSELLLAMMMPGSRVGSRRRKAWGRPS
jgi:translocation and assembly module TamA